MRRRSITTSMSCFGFLQRRHAVDFQQLAVHPQAHIALRLQAGAFVLEAAFLAARDRRQHGQPGVGRPGHHGVHHLAHALRLQRQAMVRAIRRADARVQQAQVVVDLGDGADGGARVVAGGLLLDRDGRRQALDQVHIRLVHQLQELPGVGRQALDIAALALGVKRVEGERGFLPEPDRPVTTTSLWRGRSSETFLRCARTPYAYRRVHRLRPSSWHRRPTWYYSAPSSPAFKVGPPGLPRGRFEAITVQ